MKNVIGMLVLGIALSACGKVEISHRDDSQATQDRSIVLAHEANPGYSPNRYPTGKAPQPKCSRQMLMNGRCQ